MSGEPSPGGSAGEEAQRLGGVVHPERGATRGRRRDPGYERRQTRLQYVEGDEEGKQQRDGHGEVRIAHREADLDGEQESDGREEEESHPAAALGLDERREHPTPGTPPGRRTHPPAPAPRQPAGP